jgi:hypothetical protein
MALWQLVKVLMRAKFDRDLRKQARTDFLEKTAAEERWVEEAGERCCGGRRWISWGKFASFQFSGKREKCRVISDQ